MIEEEVNGMRMMFDYVHALLVNFFFSATFEYVNKAFYLLSIEWVYLFGLVGLVVSSVVYVSK